MACGWRALARLAKDFIGAPDGSLIDE